MLTIGAGMAVCCEGDRNCFGGVFIFGLLLLSLFDDGIEYDWCFSRGWCWIGDDDSEVAKDDADDDDVSCGGTGVESERDSFAGKQSTFEWATEVVCLITEFGFELIDRFK